MYNHYTGLAFDAIVRLLKRDLERLRAGINKIKDNFGDYRSTLPERFPELIPHTQPDFLNYMPLVQAYDTRMRPLIMDVSILENSRPEVGGVENINP